MEEDDFFDTKNNQSPDDDFFASGGEPSATLPVEHAEDPTYYERLSYGKVMYRRVQRLRRKAKRRGIEVPYLCYELHKPEKPRVMFWIVAILAALLFVGIVVGIGFLYAVLAKSLTGMSNFGEAFGAMFKPEVLAVSLGTSALPAILLVLVYIMLAGLLMIPLLAIGYFYVSVRDTFYMAKCSKEEFAKGNIISGRVKRLSVILFILTVIFLVGMLTLKVASAKLILGVIYGALVLVLGSLLALIMIEKHKNAKWFEGLNEAQKQNYLGHSDALRGAKHKRNKLW